MKTSTTVIIPQKEKNIHKMTVNIPKEMKEIPQWVGWKGAPKVGKDGKKGLSKEPYALSGAYRLGFQNVHTFDEVMASYKKGNIDGIGFAMSKEAGYICIDLDGDKLEDIPETLLSLTNHSYAERSPSGNGVHIWFKGDWPGEKNTKGKEVRYTKDGFKTEIFYETGFLTCTGDAINDLDIEENQPMIDFIYNNTKRNTENASSTAVVNHEPAKEDDEIVLAAALKKRVTAKTFEGDTTLYNNDDSDADWALAKDFARLTNNADQIERLMWRSEMVRDKWHQRPDYVKETVAKAMLAIAVEKEKEDLTLRVKEDATPELQEDALELTYFGGDKGTTFIPKWLGDDILREYPLFFDGNSFFVYKDGVYHRDQGGIIGRIVVDKLGDTFKSDRLKETQTYLKHKRWIKPESMNNRTDLINVKNGLLEWKTGVLHPHTPKYYSTVQLPITFDPAAEAPSTKKFLQEVVESDTVPTLYEWFGYSMIPSTRYEKAMILTGSGANGKSVFLKLYGLFMGDSNISHVDLQSLESNRFKLAQLQGKLANVYADISAQAMEKTNVFKTLVSGDKVSAEFKGSNSFDFVPFARLTFSANELPKSSDLTDGYFRRLIIVDFPNTFGENGLKRDPHIMDKLSTEKELSGLLNLALEGLQRLERNGKFSENQNTIDAINEYKREIDPLVTFLEECCQVGEEYSASKQSLYDLYVGWTHRSGVKALGKTKFYKRLNASVELKEYRPSSDSDRRYKGIGILSSARN